MVSFLNVSFSGESKNHALKNLLQYSQNVESKLQLNRTEFNNIFKGVLRV